MQRHETRSRTSAGGVQRALTIESSSSAVPAGIERDDNVLGRRWCTPVYKADLTAGMPAVESARSVAWDGAELREGYCMVARSFTRLLVVLFIASACGGVATSSPSPAASATAAASASQDATKAFVAKLYDDAKKEGSFVWYAQTDEKIVQQFADAFAKTYPGV